MIAAEVKYKKLNNEWVSEIPYHWQYLKLKFVSKLQGGYAFKSGDFDYDGIPVIRISDVNDVFNEDQCPKYPLKKEKIDDAFKVVNNDILIALTGATIGKTCLISELKKFAYLNQRVAKVKSQDPFIYYCLSSKFVQEQIKLKCYGSAQENISNSDIENFYIPYPPIEERQSIVDKLNSESAKITRFIQTKQRFIELLKEQRQSIITNAVTKGIDDGVKMKKTVLGEIPEHWEVRRLATIGRFSKGGNISRSELIYTEDGVPAILYGDIYTKYDIVAENIINRISKETAANSVELKKGDLLFTGSGETKEDIGKCVVFNSNEPVYAGGDVIIFKQDIFDSHFISYSQNSSIAKHQKAISSKGEIIVHTYGSKLRDVIMPYPPTVEEQKQIVEYIKTETRTLDIAISKAEREIELIKEYREAMIAEAVTGKMKL